MMPSDTLLLETIRIENGDIYNLPYHQARSDRSRKVLFGTTDTLSLSSVIQPPSDGLYRCRILYGREVHSVEYTPYLPKKIQRLQIISSDISYDHKYADRSGLEALLQQCRDSDDILIEKEGYLTDTSIANIAFYNGKQWLTPETPLLHGTMRQSLIDSGFLQTAKIKKEEIESYSHVALMNAMIGFKILKGIDLALARPSNVRLA
jgi:4-amino-4-deoxychorismate lyase